MNSLLFVIKYRESKLKKSVFLAIYNEEKRSAKYMSTIGVAPFDFAWAPGKNLFVTTHRDRMILYQKNAEGGYNGTAIRCPVDFMYTFFSWNPKGVLLAVNCFDHKTSGRRLGLYELKEEMFVMSDIVIDLRPLIWKDDSTLYAMKDDKVLEVKLESGTLSLARTIPIEKEVSQFYGMYDDQALILVWKDKQIKLGNKTLVELDRSDTNRVVATPIAIFVSVSPTDLVVFDHKGREINRTNPGRTIKFGSIGKDPNTVYGLAGSMLLRVSVENGNLNIEEVVDLSDDSIYVMPGILENTRSDSKPAP